MLNVKKLSQQQAFSASLVATALLSNACTDQQPANASEPDANVENFAIAPIVTALPPKLAPEPKSSRANKTSPKRRKRDAAPKAHAEVIAIQDAAPPPAPDAPVLERQTMLTDDYAAFGATGQVWSSGP